MIKRWAPVIGIVLTAIGLISARYSAFAADYSQHKASNAADIARISQAESDTRESLKRINDKLDRLLEK